MDESFQSERAALVHLGRNKCPFASGSFQPNYNMRSRTNLDPDTLGANGVGTSAGTVREGGTHPLDESTHIKYRTSFRGRDAMTNYGTETYQNERNSYNNGNFHKPGFNKVLNHQTNLQNFISYT